MAISICFVCLGNICRSPTAEGIMHKLVEDAGLSAHIALDSAGTGAWHAGEQADSRSRETARARGVELLSISRQFLADDLDRFDYVIAMDESNARNIRGLAVTETHLKKIHLLRSFDPYSGTQLSVPDPYYNDGFDHVFDICQAGCEGLLKHIAEAHGLPLT